MKKIIIGVTSAVLAMMPAVGVFAANQTSTATDTLSATITAACSFLRYGEAGSDSQTGISVKPSWSGSTTSNAANSTTNTYSATFQPTADVELGTSHFIAYCNSAKGFDVTVDTPSLSTGGTNPNTIAFSGSTTPDSSTGEGWTLKLSSGDLFANATGDKFMTSDMSTDSDSAITETATYKIYTKSTTKSGAYTANVIYTFTYDDPNM